MVSSRKKERKKKKKKNESPDLPQLGFRWRRRQLWSVWSKLLPPSHTDDTEGPTCSRSRCGTATVARCFTASAGSGRMSLVAMWFSMVFTMVEVMFLLQFRMVDADHFEQKYDEICGETCVVYVSAANLGSVKLILAKHQRCPRCPLRCLGHWEPAVRLHGFRFPLHSPWELVLASLSHPHLRPTACFKSQTQPNTLPMLEFSPALSGLTAMRIVFAEGLKPMPLSLCTWMQKDLPKLSQQMLFPQRQEEEQHKHVANVQKCSWDVLLYWINCQVHQVHWKSANKSRQS